jgi:hypothetical protein
LAEIVLLIDAGAQVEEKEKNREPMIAARGGP